MILILVAIALTYFNTKGVFLKGKPSAGIYLMAFALFGMGAINSMESLSKALSSEEYVEATTATGEKVQVKILEDKVATSSVVESSEEKQEQCSRRRGSLVHTTSYYPCTAVYKKWVGTFASLAQTKDGIKILVNTRQDSVVKLVSRQ